MDGIEKLAAAQEAARNGSGPAPLTDVAPRTLAEVVTTFERWQYLPDPGVVVVALGTVAANLMPGDPVWTVLVGPPGAGKSEALQSTIRLPNVFSAGTLTEPALLSGSSKRDHAKDARGGLLRTLGDFGIIVCKDFGSVLNMRREDRASLLAAMREIYDGAWTRHVGTDGGRTLHWSGKVGFLGGATPGIDRHHGVMAAMGERLVLYRLPLVDDYELAHRALRHAGHEETMRRELAEAVAGLFIDGLPREPRGLSDEDRERLVSLTTLVVRSRSAVERDGYSREIELVPGSEAPTRLVIVLDRLLAGLDAIGLDRPAAWQLVSKVALDSIPALRRSMLATLAERGGEPTTSELAEAVAHPTVTTRRALEDLAAHGVVDRHSHGQGKAATWMLPAWTRERYESAMTFPEMSGAGQTGAATHENGDAKPSSLSPLSTKEDISEKVGGDLFSERFRQSMGDGGAP